ncbi:hypothetical protein Q763_13485 [Flavobacterium beibuense F44-8]|uniref:C-type lectin domain-containing protein n=2 Tax=Flavobacterium beibuense TaxID=657326 RepID=A0A0A2LTQ1_9FLAO|nr:hypothetical protein Q763_13485 [Flavobacterium beibuense F44-8]
MNTQKTFFCYFYGMKSHKSAFLVLLVSCFFSLTAKAQDNPPVLTATGDQIYCPGTPVNIVSTFNITDADDTETNAVYIQIASGYVNGQDVLSLNTTIPNITSSWNSSSGKLTIEGVGGQSVPYSSLITAVQNVVYNNTSANPNGTRTFSITIGQANYLPSTDHYYQFVPSIGISWTAARDAAENTTYYGLQGYLATILSAEEAQLVGEQATGTGWIGGSDAQIEGVWKWVTGPEAGTTFWNGGVNGSTPNYAFWNTGEPNNQGEEDYAHITAPGVGIQGSWNDLPVNGSTGDYEPKGYIVEYGGMPGDPVLQISASTTLTIPTITSTTDAANCGEGSVTLQAEAENGTVYWYSTAIGGTPIATGNSFTTPSLSTETVYYASAFDETCTSATRTAVTAAVTAIPTLTITNPTPICGEGTTLLEATPSAGTVQWYTTPTGGSPFATGSSVTSPEINTETTFYAEAVNNGCASENREAVVVTVNELPDTGENKEVVFCENSQATLDATANNVTYLWSTGETTATITVTEPGTYTVEYTNTAGCTATKTFTVTALQAPNIERVVVNTTNATVVMANNDPENYEYSLDGVHYQSTNIFTNLNAGPHVAYARSINGCGIDIQNFYVLLIPKYITPNNDSVNDVFTIAGMANYPYASITIFDRYGKTITRLNSRNRSWDGTYNGHNLPASDYWYVIQLSPSEPEIKGHFALIR